MVNAKKYNSYESDKNIKEKLLKLIQQEDKKNPLTDEECAKQLFLNRSEITQLRQAIGIPDSRERRRPLMIEEMKKILEESPGISERNLTTELNKRGWNVSRASVSKVLKISNIKPKFEKNQAADLDRPETDTGKEHIDPFSVIIGWNQSLRLKVEQAKAAVFYPPNGLHTLIIGATGVGKSKMAECMYKFALKVKNKDPKYFPFIVFNCADYAENPQLLLAQLFGYRKGAFTGAETDKEGLVAKANGGILLLDEVHRLPPEGQEMLFQLIDKGKYRELGETGIVHEAKVMIIAATTEDIEKSLLTTFRRRIPMVIELPPLAMRPIEERLEIIKMVFHQEADRINRKIAVNYSVIRTLLIYNCIGNIGQLRSDIQVACARGFLNYMSKGNTRGSIIIDACDLPIHVTKSLLDSNWDREKIERLIDEDEFIFLPSTIDIKESRESIYIFPNDIYKNIEEEYQKLLKQGLSDEVINRIISDDLETKVKKIIRQIEKNKHKLITQDLKKVVRPEVVDLVQEMIKVTGSELGERKDTLLYCLATHFNAALDRIRSGKYINNSHLNDIKKHYPKEYKMAKEMASLANYYLHFELPEEEIGFIAMYLRTLTSKIATSKETIGIVVVSHGNVAEGMASIANRLLGVDMVKAVEMSIDEKPEYALKRTEEAVMKVDRGKGVLLMVDMGSLTGFGNYITKKLGIKTRTVTRVDTLMVIDAIRKALLPGADLNTIADGLIKDKSIVVSPFEEIQPNIKYKYAVISLCLTGQGMAKHIESVIKDSVHSVSDNIEIVNLGILNERDIIEQINEIDKRMNVLAIVGTIDPRHTKIPFISSAEVLKDEGLKKLINIVQIRYNNFHHIQKRFNAFNKDLIITNKDVRDKNEALNLLADMLVRKGYVTSNFIKGVKEREQIGTTAIGNLLAIPHSYSSDDIIKPAIGVMTLKQPVEWFEGSKISLIFMLALTEQSKREFQHVYRLIKNQRIVDRIIKTVNADDILHILENI